MGLYSTNRVASVAESSDALIESMDWTPDFSIGSVMEAVIQIHENDAKMFDSLIECDFISANNISIMTEAEAEQANSANDEKKKSKIGEKIHAIIEAIKNFIQKAAANAIAKITDFVKSDQKIYNAYKDVLKVENLKDFEGIKDFAYPSNKLDSKNIKELGDQVEKFVSVAKNAKTRDAIDSAHETFQNESDKIINKINAEIAWGFQEKQSAWKPNQEQIGEMLGVVKNASAIIKGIKEHTAVIIGELKKLQNDAKAVLKSKAETSETEVYIANKMFQVASSSAKLFSKEFAAYNRTATKQIAAYRKAVILCGRAAAKSAKGTDESKSDKTVEQEAAAMYVLGESSDAYVYECLAY